MSPCAARVVSIENVISERENDVLAVVFFHEFAECFAHVRDHVELDDFFGGIALARVGGRQVLQKEVIGLLESGKTRYMREIQKSLAVARALRARSETGAKPRRFTPKPSKPPTQSARKKPKSKEIISDSD